MAVKDVTRDAVESALAEFRRTNLQAMLERYGGGPSTKWYVQDGNLLYDQKLVVRAAHVLQGLGDLYPRGPGSFDAAQALSLLDRLDYRVVSKLSPTNANLEGPSATEPLARWLIGAARQVPPATLTYGEAASRLEKECGSSRIPRASRVGRTAASLQYAIHARDPSAPLLNVLLVRQDTGLTASGAQEFIAARYPEETRLAEKGADTALELVAADQRLKLHVRVVENAMDLADLLRQVPTDRAATRHTTVATILAKLVRDGHVEHHAAGGYRIVDTATRKWAAPNDAARHPDALRFPVPGSPIP